MRSVVVVLPASMCAMIPMLRVLASWAALLAICRLLFVSGPRAGARGWPGVPAGGGLGGAGRDARPAVPSPSLARVRVPGGGPAFPPAGCWWTRCVTSGVRLPAVVREGLVRLGHLVGVLAALDRGTEAVAGVEQLVHEALGHRLLAARPAVLDEPAQAEGGAAGGADLDRDLARRPPAPARRAPAA